MTGFSFAAIRSIQLKIALIAGLCLSGTIVILVGYSLYSTKITHDLVSTEVKRLVDDQTKESLLNRATSEARFLKGHTRCRFSTRRAPWPKHSPFWPTRKVPRP